MEFIYGHFFNVLNYITKERKQLCYGLGFTFEKKVFKNQQANNIDDIMRVIIPVLPQKEGLIISQHFGRAPEFAIFEMPEIEKPKEVFKNTVPPTMKEHSGRGRLVLEMLLSKNFDVIITKEIGPGAFYEFKNRGIKIYQSNDRTPKDALKKLLSGELTELTAPNE